MKIQFKNIILGFGDIIVLGFFFFFTGFTTLPSEPPDAFFYMILATIPFLISWILINIILGMLSSNVDFKKLFVKLFLGCLINTIIGIICQYLLAKILVKYGEPTFDIEVLIYIWIGEFIVIVIWRIIHLLLQTAFQNKKYPIIRKSLIVSVSVLAGLVVLVSLLYAYVVIRYSSDIYNVNNFPKAPVAIVFGAGLNPDGSPSVVLKERVIAAVNLYQSGKVEKLLMSGGQTSNVDDEPDAMKKLAFELGVPESKILIDYGGDRTYATCQHAKAIYQFNHAILVAQNFYLPRALLICNALGISSVGVSADKVIYAPQTYFFGTIREIFATNLALWEIYGVSR